MKRKRLKKLLMATGETRDNAEIVSMLWRGKARALADAVNRWCWDERDGKVSRPP